MATERQYDYEESRYNLKLLGLSAVSSDPADPDNGEAVLWLSDGTGSGNDGDLMAKMTNTSGTTTAKTVQSFS